jgi:hypothetical protein
LQVRVLPPGVGEVAFAAGAVEGDAAEEVFVEVDLVVGRWVVGLELGGELVALVVVGARCRNDLPGSLPRWHSRSLRGV